MALFIGTTVSDVRREGDRSIGRGDGMGLFLAGRGGGATSGRSARSSNVCRVGVGVVHNLSILGGTQRLESKVNNDPLEM